MTRYLGVFPGFHKQTLRVVHDSAFEKRQTDVFNKGREHDHVLTVQRVGRHAPFHLLQKFRFGQEGLKALEFAHEWQDLALVRPAFLASHASDFEVLAEGVGACHGSRGFTGLLHFSSLASAYPRYTRLYRGGPMYQNNQ